MTQGIDPVLSPDGSQVAFTRWNGTEGYMRWRVTQTMGEDDDGYVFNHPQTTSRPIYISFISRVGSTWWSSHTSADRFKFVMFYPNTGTNPPCL